MTNRRTRLIGACLMAALLVPRAAAAQLGSLTVTLSPGPVNFTLANGSAVNPGDTTLSATTAWSLSLLGSSLALYGYFSSSTAALVHTAAANTFDIASSRVEVSVNGGAKLPFNQTIVFGAAGAGRQLFSQSIALVAFGNRTDTLALNINLAGASLPADSYTGTLRVRARISP